MFKSIIERVYKEANFFCDNYSTVREVAKKFKISKSTVHLDLTKRLYNIDYELYLKVKNILEYNKNIRHIRGGESTRKRYIKQEEAT